jgi:hypothetical protein
MAAWPNEGGAVVVGEGETIVGSKTLNLTTVELKAFVPSKDLDVSKQFYQDLGFTVVWSNEGLAYRTKVRASERSAVGYPGF